MKRLERRTIGRAACAKVIEKRIADVIRIYVTEEALGEFRDALRELAKAKKAYHIVSVADLNKITESIHHEGICVLAKAPLLPSVEGFLQSLSPIESQVALYLENVSNPHNIGAIVRVAAHFGAKLVCVESAKETLAALDSPVVARTAEGGMEGLTVLPVENGSQALAAFRKHKFQIFATSSHAKESLYESKFPKKTLFLLGGEKEGLSQAALHSAHVTLGIPGTGAVESLNVACAATALLAEYFRQARSKA
jgi:RNA methyltransferase, TrmH family